MVAREGLHDLANALRLRIRDENLSEPPLDQQAHQLPYALAVQFIENIIQ
jgi:hypothetical protein